MPTIADFDIATDLKVEFYIPSEADNLFIIGVSELGGDDVLAGAGLFIIGTSLIGGGDVLGDSEFVAFNWEDLTCTTSKAQLQLGGKVQSTLYFQPEPARAQLELQTFDYDPNRNRAVRPGTQIRVRLAKGDVDEILFQGTIDTIQTAYLPTGQNKLNINAFDDFKKLVNTRLALFDSDTDFPEGFVTPYEQIELLAEGFGTSMNAQSEQTAGEIPSTILEDVIPNDLLYEAIQVGLGLFWIDPTTKEFVFIPRPEPSDPPEGTLIIGDTHSSDPLHLCMSDLQTGSDTNKVFNSLKVTLASDETTSVVREDQDSIDLYGRFAQDVTINTTDSAELERWANAVFNQFPKNLVDSVETPAVNRLGTLTQAAFIKPGQLVGVQYSQDVLQIDDYYTVTRVSHYIDPNVWLTTLDTWKEV
jgi:hypothetical protein